MTPDEKRDKATKLKEKAMKHLKELFLPEEMVLLAEELKAAVTPPAPTDLPASKEAKEMKTKDGVSLFIDGLDADGKPVKNTSKAFADKAATSPMNDGDYILDNDMIVTVASGIVTDFKPAQDLIPPVGDMADMKAQLAEHKKELEKANTKLADQETDFKAELEKMKKTNLVLLKFMDKIVNAPIVTPAKTGELKPVSEMSNAEKMRHERGIPVYKTV